MSTRSRELAPESVENGHGRETPKQAVDQALRQYSLLIQANRLSLEAALAVLPNSPTATLGAVLQNNSVLAATFTELVDVFRLVGNQVEDREGLQRYVEFEIQNELTKQHLPKMIQEFIMFFGIAAFLAGCGGGRADGQPDSRSSIGSTGTTIAGPGQEVTEPTSQLPEPILDQLPEVEMGMSRVVIFSNYSLINGSLLVARVEDPDNWDGGQLPSDVVSPQVNIYQTTVDLPNGFRYQLSIEPVEVPVDPQHAAASVDLRQPPAGLTIVELRFRFDGEVGQKSHSTRVER